MPRGKFFAKAHFRGPEDIAPMVELIEAIPGLDGLDICVFGEIAGVPTNLSLIRQIVDGRIPVSLEYGDTHDTREVVDFLNPAKAYMLAFVREKLIPAANAMGAVGINLHLVANATNIHPGKLPPRFHPREDTLNSFRDVLLGLQAAAGCSITVENVHCISTRRNVDDCIKFAPIGNTVQDFFDLNWPGILDTAHLGMSLFTYQILRDLEEKGQLERVDGREDYVWCPTQPGPYLVRFGARERSMVQLLPTDLTEALVVVLEKLHQVGLLKAVHLSNLAPRTPGDPFAYWDKDDKVVGAFDLRRILEFIYYKLGVTVIAELKEVNYNEPEEPGFRSNLLQVVEMLKN